MAKLVRFLNNTLPTTSGDQDFAVACCSIHATMCGQRVYRHITQMLLSCASLYYRLTTCVYQSAWHLPAVYAMLLAFWSSWRQLHVCLMILHDGKDKSLYHLAFVGAQMIGMLLMGAFVFHARDCGGVETSTGGCVEYAGAGFDCAVLGSALSVCAWYLFAALIEPQQAAHLTTPRISFATFLRLQALLRCPMILASLIHLTSMPKSEPEALLYTYFPGCRAWRGGDITSQRRSEWRQEM